MRIRRRRVRARIRRRVDRWPPCGNAAREAVVEFTPPLSPGVLIRRYKRFLADVETARGERMTVHCANTGAMLGCADPGSPIWYSTSAAPRRKYRHGLELVQSAGGDLIVVNTARANAVAAEAAAAGLLGGPPGAAVRREVTIAGVDGRFDLAVGDAIVEVKSATLLLPDSGAFPDAVSERATRHVQALGGLARQGRRTVLAFCAMHAGIKAVRPADEIDPVYGAALRRAVADGMEVVALRCAISTQRIVPVGLLPVRLAARSPRT